MKPSNHPYGAGLARTRYPQARAPLAATLSALVALGLASISCPVASCLAQQSGQLPFVRVPNPLSGENPVHKLVRLPLPEIGKPFKGLPFGMEMMRVTQEKGLRQEYSRFDPFNKDHSLILLHYPPQGDWRVYRTSPLPYDRKGNLVMSLDMDEPRWDPKEPQLIWGLERFRIVTLNVKTGAKTIVKDFAQDDRIGPILKAEPDLYRITTKKEGEASWDMRYWALFLQGSKEDHRPRYILTWDNQQKRLLGLYKMSKEEGSADWVGMSPLGTYVVIGGDFDTGGRLKGLTMADPQLKKFHRLDYGTAHSDVALDIHGKEVIVMQSTRTDYIDLIPLAWTTKPILENGDKYAGSNHVPLVRLHYSSDSPFGLSSEIHISCNTPGYCVVSTFTDPKMKEKNWLDRALILVKLDPKRPEAYYLAKLHNTTAQYWEETQATISRDGSKVVWADNWGQNVGKDQCFLMQLNMPKDWQKRLSQKQK